MQTSKIILKLLYKSSNWLLKLSFLALPIALLLSMSSYLFISNVLDSYENYLVKSYIGIQGRVSIESKDKKFIDDVVEYSKKEGLTFSTKKELKTSLVFLGDRQIPKYAKFIVLDLEYLKSKFKNLHVKTNTIFVNKTFSNSLGSLDISSFKQCYFDDEENVFDIESILTVDTGFLTSEPVIFVSSEFARNIFGDTKSSMVKVEFLESNEESITKIKDNSEAIAKKNNTMEFKIHDLIEDTKSTREFFEKVSLIQNAISILIFILSMGIILLSISISVEFKKNSLKTLQLIGMSARDLSSTISLSIFSMIMVVLVLCVFMQKIFQSMFLKASGFSNGFFTPLALENIYYIVLLAFILLFINNSITRYVFSR
ncbi:hypothetical protein N9A28_07320 [Sulfurimonas sp.]|nr:hypothetical protein [Sulfurimonas sp.]